MANEYILNPSVDLQDSIQVRGLDPNSRDPHSYLKMVAKTFSAFKETSLSSRTISYIHGLTVDYMFIDKSNYVDYLSVEDALRYLDTGKKYHVFRVNPGACFIDDQFIEFSKPAIFLFEKPVDDRPIDLAEDLTNPSFDGQAIKLFKNLKYKIVIEYQWLEQYPVEKARIKIVADEASYDNLNYPYFKVAGFNTDNDGNIIRSEPEVFSNITGAELQALVDEQDLVSITNSDNSISYYKRGVDPQQLSKKYIDNYKSLFANMQDQMYTIFNNAGLSKSTFNVIENTDIEIGLKSGTMVYFDQRDNLYKPAKSSRQKVDKVIGLYLYDYHNDTHIVFFGGMIDLDPDNVLIGLKFKKLVRETTVDGEKILTFQNRYGLTYNHPLVNLEVGNHYYLEDDSRYFTNSLLMYDLENYIEWDTRGFISTRHFPGAVNVGYAVDRTKLLLNINSSNEVDWENAVDLYGNHKLFSDEFQSVYSFYSNQVKITKLEENKLEYTTERDNLNSYLGNYITTSTYPDITSSGGVRKVLDTNSPVLPDYIVFAKWFNNYLLGNVNNINRFPDFSSTVAPSLYKLNIPAIDFTEADTDAKVIYFNEQFCGGVQQTQTEVLNSPKTLRSNLSILSHCMIQNSKIISIFNTAISTITSNILNISNNSVLNELNNLVKIKRLELGDDPDTVNEVIEDTASNIIRDLGIKYTDENQTTISLDTLTRVDSVATIQNRTNKIIAIQGSISSTENSIEAATAILESFKEEVQSLMVTQYKLQMMYNLCQEYATKIESKISSLEKAITSSTLNVIEFNKLKTIAAAQRNTMNTLSLDIFYLSNYERKRYNYTYLVDRILFEFSLSETLAQDKTIASNKLSALTANGSNAYDIELARLEVDRLNNRIDKNNENIKNYTNEVNLILTEFNRPLILLGDKNFIIENDLINENPNNFKFGVDYGPVGTNNERYLVNEAFREVARLNMEKLKNGEIIRAEFPDRFLPSIYVIPGSGFMATDFVATNFKTLTFSNSYTSNPYFYITLDKVKHIVYSYDGKYYLYSGVEFLLAGLPDVDFNTIMPEESISNLNGEIIEIIGTEYLSYQKEVVVNGNIVSQPYTETIITDNYYVRKTSENTFVKLEPVALDSEELSRFVREARVKSVSEEYNNILTYVEFMNYFINKEAINTNVEILNGYIHEIDNMEILGYNNEITISLPVIAPSFTTLITDTTIMYNDYLNYRIHLNTLINILSLTGSKTTLTVLDISDTTLITYGLTSAFRTYTIETRSHMLTQIMDSYRTLLFDTTDSVKLEIQKYRDTDILNILSNNTEFNTNTTP